MSYINFIISRINYLSYYIPIVIEAKKRGISTNFFLCQSTGKPFVCPYHNMDELKTLSKKYDIMLYDITKLSTFPGITFFCEGDIVGKPQKKEPSPNFKYMTSEHTKVSLVCNYEYVMFYDDYIHNIDYVILPHKFWEGYYQCKSSKNLYLGSPKYDMEYYKKEMKVDERQLYLTNKYGLDINDKYVLIVYPKNPKKHHKKNTLYPSEEILLKIYKAIREIGYKVIVKTRKQDPVTKKLLRGDYYFEDIDYFPCNSMELIEISSIVIYFSSSINEECIALKTPYIDFKVDLNKNRFNCLYDNTYGICWDYANLVSFDVVKRTKKLLMYLETIHYQPTKIDSNKVFDTYYNQIVWTGGNGSSRRIIDWVESNYKNK
jgi:hypothetical protein